MKHALEPHHAFHQESSIAGRAMDRETWTDPSSWPAEWTEIELKTYPRLRSVALPPPAGRCRISLAQAIRNRRTVREISPEPLELDDLSELLAEALGFAGDSGGRPRGARRNYPSAGARFPTECYVVAMRCAGLDEGLYHYGPSEHRLTQLGSAPMSKAMAAAFGHDWIAGARAVLLVTAVMKRTVVKYGARGYRFALLEAGHAMQNLCLVATGLGQPLAPIGGFADQVVARMLDVSGRDELPLYAAVLP